VTAREQKTRLEVKNHLHGNGKLRRRVFANSKSKEKRDFFSLIFLRRGKKEGK